jgi:hypothetical protein
MSATEVSVANSAGGHAYYRDFLVTDAKEYEHSSEEHCSYTVVIRDHTSSGMRSRHTVEILKRFDRWITVIVDTVSALTKVYSPPRLQL